MLTPLSASYVAPVTDPALTETDAATIAAFVAQLQTVAHAAEAPGVADNLPTFLEALHAIVGSDGNVPARSFAGVSAVLDAAAAFADTQGDHDFANKLRLGAQLIGAVRSALGA